MKTVISFIFIAASIGIFLGFTTSHYEHIKELRVQAEDYNNALTQSKLLLAQRDALEKKYNEIPQENLDKLKKLVPDSIDNVRLIIDMNGIAERRGMSIRSPKIQTNGASKTGTIGPDNNPYGSMQLSFAVTAPYETFKAFLEDLERSLRIVDITALSFTAVDKGDIYDYSVTMRTYWLRQ